jgi:hypothetical protein
MKCGVKVALAAGACYVLGRRKVRLVTMLALGAAAAGGGGKLGPAVLRQGAKYLGKTDIAGALGPQVTEIVDTIRGDLLDAGKAAAAAAVTSRLDSLTGSLHERAETLKNPEAAAGKAGETAGEAAGRAGETAARAGGTLGRRGRRRRGAGEEEEAGPGRDEEQDEGRGGGRARRGARSESEQAEEPEGGYDEEQPAEDEEEEEAAAGAPADEAGELEEEQEPAPRRRRPARSPVTRGQTK